MPDRAPDAWMTSSAGPFLTMNAGGPLEGVVTISVATKGDDELLVDSLEVRWRPPIDIGDVHRLRRREGACA